jgi:pectate lyase
MQRTIVALAMLMLLASCDSSPGTTHQGEGGTQGLGGGSGSGSGSGGIPGTGGIVGTGGTQGSGGATGAIVTGRGGATGTGGASQANGGTVQGGATGSGGVARDAGAAAGGSTAGTGGAMGQGGATTGGGATGNGGAAGATPGTGGAPATGGVPTGGTATGGRATGGAASGGAAGSGGGMNAQACQPMGWATRNGRTGGAVEVTGGGSTAPVIVKTFSDLQSNASGSAARVIYIDGTLGSGWSGRSGDRLAVGSNKTIIGIRPGTELKATIHVNNSSNVIIRNLVIRGPGSNSEQAWDNLNIEGSSKNVWIDHCEFWDGQDGNADVVKGADNVTFTWNIFGYRKGGGHNFSNLVASSDDEPVSQNKLNITLMFNWFTGVAQRQPRCRYGDIHVVNNLFSRDGQESDYGISAGKDCRIVTEANHFIGINSPIYTSHKSGSAANELRGGNIFEGTSGNTTGYGTAFNPPYEYQSLLIPASQVKAHVSAGVGATLASPTSCQ